MTAIQKTIAIATLAFVAVFFHVLFCDWETGDYHQHFRQHSESHVVIPLGPMAGIYARSLGTHATDAVLGVAFPIALVGLGFFILAGRTQDASNRPGT